MLYSKHWKVVEGSSMIGASVHLYVKRLDRLTRDNMQIRFQTASLPLNQLPA